MVRGGNGRLYLHGDEVQLGAGQLGWLRAERLTNTNRLALAGALSGIGAVNC
jgi:hypothetical protein